MELTVTSSMPGDWKMHWAVDEWTLPPNEAWPNNTTQMDDKAVQTPFQDGRVVINFPPGSAPNRLVFVITNGDKWLNKGGAGDFTVALAPPSLKATLDDIIDSEQNSSLFQRYQKVLSLAGEMALAGDEGLALLFTWLRFSANKQLRWYHKEVYNYQARPLVLCHSSGCRIRLACGDSSHWEGTENRPASGGSRLRQLYWGLGFTGWHSSHALVFCVSREKTWLTRRKS